MTPNAPSASPSIEEKFAGFPELFEELDGPDGRGMFIPSAEYPMTFVREHAQTMNAIAEIVQKDANDSVLLEFEQEFDALLAMIERFRPLEQEAIATREIQIGINGAKIEEVRKSILKAIGDHTSTIELDQKLSLMEKRQDIMTRFHEARRTLVEALEKFRDTILKIRRHSFMIRREER